MRLEIKRHNINFYFAIAFAFLFFSGIGCLLISVYFNEREKIKQGNTTYFLSAMGVLFIVFAFYTIYQYFKNTPKIVVEKGKIFFNKEMFNLDDIQFVNLTCKVPFRYIANYPMEGCYIKFKNGKHKFIYDEMYSNTSKIKDYLRQVVLEKKEYIESEIQTIKPNVVKNEHFAYYKGIQLLSLSGIVFWVCFFMFSGIIFVSSNHLVWFKIFLVVFTFLIYFFGSRIFSHYGVSKNHLIIENFNLPYKKRVYKLDTIEEIVFEAQPKRPNGLRVITKDFKSKLYIGATLYDNTWRELKKDLRKKGIKVRDECIDYEY